MTLKADYFNTSYPSCEYLRKKAKKRIPGFAFDYLESGANEEINLYKNKHDFYDIEFMPEYIKNYGKPNTKASLFGQEYGVPFGIAPVGLQGLMWPNAPVILAKAAAEKNIPFVLSTVSTSSIETIAKVTNGQFWFQLYHPVDDELRDDILKRIWDAGCKNLVILADTPKFGIRYKDVKNGLSMPPKMTLSNIMQIMSKPNWALQTLYYGKPGFATVEKYMNKGLNMKQLGKFMNDTFNGRLTEEKIAKIRAQWKGNLIIKGIVNDNDLERCVGLGVDGIIVSNHGGRQIDGGESTIRSLKRIVEVNKNRLTVMMDGGVRSGVDIMKAVATGADFVFMGRPFMYGAGALGSKGGLHTINMFAAQVNQVMEQLGVEEVLEVRSKLV